MLEKQKPFYLNNYQRRIHEPIFKLLFHWGRTFDDEGLTGNLNGHFVVSCRAKSNKYKKINDTG